MLLNFADLFIDITVFLIYIIAVQVHYKLCLSQKILSGISGIREQNKTGMVNEDQQGIHNNNC